jgi:hypothetical protein
MEKAGQDCVELNRPSPSDLAERGIAIRPRRVQPASRAAFVVPQIKCEIVKPQRIDRDLHGVSDDINT